MYKIIGSNVYITRGDSAYITVNIADNDGNKFALDTGHIVRGQVRREPNNGDLVVDADIDYSNPDKIIWHIKPENTKGIEVKEYYYDLEVDTAEGDVYTFVSGKFVVTDEVTY